jgi:CheY-like chemotaxis protein
MPTPRNTAWRVLVVDDEPLVCDSIEWMFAVDGHQVETATSGKRALAMFETGKFALIIVDYEMPGMNGDELAVAIKARDPNQPIVMITN